MDEDTVFTKRFIDCIKKAQSERNEQVRDGPWGCVGLEWHSANVALPFWKGRGGW